MTAPQDLASALLKLHEGPKILVLPNAWDVASAKVIAAAGAKAIASSSAGVATALGYADGQHIPRSEMLDMVRRIARGVSLPVTADLESGYGDTPDAAAQTARAALEAGAVGMNLEDSKGSVEGELMPIDLQAARIRAARAAAESAGIHLVINGRTDAFAARALATDARVEEAIRRGNAYLEAGADCAFVPFVTKPEIIARLVREIRGPVNILGVPASPPIPELEKMGVRRVSAGSGPARAAYATAGRVARELLTSGTYDSLRDAIQYAEMQKLFGG
jgi:2-methylisocitrate lyase-like PEP mutase family enzyme